MIGSAEALEVFVCEIVTVSSVTETMVAWHQTECSVLRQKPVYLMFNIFIYDIKANFSQCTK